MHRRILLRAALHLIDIEQTLVNLGRGYPYPLVLGRRTQPSLSEPTQREHMPFALQTPDSALQTPEAVEKRKNSGSQKLQIKAGASYSPCQQNGDSVNFPFHHNLHYHHNLILGSVLSSCHTGLVL